MSMSIINRERVVVRGITWWNGAYTEKILSDPSLMPTITSHPIRGRDSVENKYEQKLELSNEDVANALTTVASTSMLLEVYSELKEIEPLIVRSVGRDPDNPSDRLSKNLEQRLEIQSDHIANTLSTVQKDNYVLEASAIRMVRNDEGKRLRKQYEAHEIKHGFNEYREPEIRDDGCCNTISTVQKDNMIVEPCIIQRVGDRDKENYSVHGDYVNCIPSNPMSDREQVVCIKQATSKGYIECENGGVVDLSYPDSKSRRGRVQDRGTISPTILAGNSDICKITIENRSDVDMNNEIQYRIRKLTPKECFRLMGVKDEDYEKLTVSNTQKYKQAGNSIVVDVLMAIFDNMFVQECKSNMLF